MDSAVVRPVDRVVVVGAGIAGLAAAVRLRPSLVAYDRVERRRLDRAEIETAVTAWAHDPLTGRRVLHRPSRCRQARSH
jgi:cation diffusion facilitator CzcD-associated flavoprotein CzcO